MAISLTLTIAALFAILFGIVILIAPKTLNYLIAIWLILYGVLQLVNLNF